MTVKPTNEDLQQQGNELEKKLNETKIKERQKMKEAFGNSEALLQSTIESLPFDFFAIDSTGRYFLQNPISRKNWGDIIGKRPEDLPVDKAYIDIWLNNNRRAFSGEIVESEVEYTFNGEKRFYFNITSPIRVGDRISGIQSVNIDITARRHIEKALLRSKLEWEKTFNAMSDWVCLIDSNRLILRSNRVAEDLTSACVEEMIGKTCCTLLHESDKPIPDCPVEIMRKSLQRETAEFYLSKADRWLQITADPVIDDAGNLLGAVHIARDITHTKKMQEEIANAQKLKSIGILAGGIAHDFNNLLSIILGNISIAAEDLQDRLSILGFLKQAERASQRAKDLANQLITFSRGEVPFKKTAPVIDFIKDTIDLALTGTGVSCNFSAPDDPFWVKYDPNQIKNAIINVIQNALEAMEKEGTISVQVKNLTIQEKDQEPGISLKEGKYVKISISDEGVGIPEKNLSLIFDPYFSTKNKGLKKGIGLGLATTDSVVRKHNGHIHVESEEGVGSTFHIYLPAADIKPIERLSSMETTYGTRRKVLVMDDERMLRDLSATILKRLFYKVELAENGEETVLLYKKAMNDGQPFDAVILDLTIRDGMGGQETVKRLLEIDPKVKAIISSGYFNDPVMTNFKDYGFCNALVKPYRIDDLKTILNKTLSSDI